MSSLQAIYKQDWSYIWPSDYSALPLAVMVSYKAPIKEDFFFLLRKKNLDFRWMITSMRLYLP